MSIRNEYVLKVDIKKHHTSVVPIFVQYDAASLIFKIYDNGVILDLSNFTNTEVAHCRPDGTTIIGNGEIITLPNGEQAIKYTYLGSEMKYLGDVATSVSLFNDNKKISILPFDVKIVKDIRDGFISAPTEEVGYLQKLIVEVQEIIKNAIEHSKILEDIEEKVKIIEEVVVIENERKVNETNRITAEDARIAAENLRKSQEITRQSNEETRIINENARISEESKRKTNEDTRIANENARKSNESTRLGSETERVNNELDRKSHETDRKASELVRTDAETTRIANETLRISKEDARIYAETARDDKESTRLSNETTRIESENVRIANESARQAEESIRASAELTRVTDMKNRIHKGLYSPTANYIKHNEVNYNGSSWRCLVDNKGVLPVEGTYWTLVALRGIDGKGSVASVNGVLPNEIGNVELYPINIGASPSDHTHSELHTHSNKNVLDAMEDVQGKLNYKGKEVGSVTSVNGQVGDVTIEKATSSKLGLTKPDGQSTIVDVDGTMRALIQDNSVGLPKLGQDVRDAINNAGNADAVKQWTKDHGIGTEYLKTILATELFKQKESGVYKVYGQNDVMPNNIYDYTVYITITKYSESESRMTLLAIEFFTGIVYSRTLSFQQDKTTYDSKWMQVSKDNSIPTVPVSELLKKQGNIICFVDGSNNNILPKINTDYFVYIASDQFYNYEWKRSFIAIEQETGKFYSRFIRESENGQTISDSGWVSSPEIVNDLTTGGSNNVASAETVKTLNTTVQNNKSEVTSHLSEIATVSKLGHIKPDGVTTVTNDITGVMSVKTTNDFTTGGANNVASAETVKLLNTKLDDKANSSTLTTLSNSFNSHASTVASTTVLGHIKVDGTTITVNSNGVASAVGSSSYTLPNATSTILGGVKIGSNINVSSGTISVNTGTTATLGVVQLSNSYTTSEQTLATTPFALSQLYTLYNNTVNGRKLIIGGAALASSSGGPDVVVIGASSSVSNDQSIAIGYSTKTTGGADSIAIGTRHTVDGTQVATFGYNNTISSGNKGMLLGYQLGFTGMTRMIQLGFGANDGYREVRTLSDTFFVGGNFVVAGTKNFAIPHPKPEKNNTHHIRHGAVESPTTGDTLYRYSLKINNETKIAKVMLFGENIEVELPVIEQIDETYLISIPLPDYFVHLNINEQVFVNANKHFGLGFGEINRLSETLEITLNSLKDYNVLLLGTRNDENVQDWYTMGVEKENGVNWFGLTEMIEVTEYMEVSEFSEMMEE